MEPECPHQCVHWKRAAREACHRITAPRVPAQWQSACSHGAGRSRITPPGGTLGSIQLGFPIVAAVESDPLIFTDDDDGYLAWLSKHPYGFVLNAERSPRAAYVKLHRTSCGHIQGRPSNGVSWTTDLLKACSESRIEIERWVRTETGGTPSACGHCHP